MLVIQMSKTGSMVRIPLSKNAASLINSRQGFLFKLYKNSKTNMLLQRLMKLAGIKKRVTFHIARHPFATLSLNMGIPMEVLSGLLGHTNLKTTQLYAKILDKTKVNMIKKWDKLETKSNVRKKPDNKF
jgi:integrase/recombinase XerC